jgi:hypothetical protein
MPLRKEGIIYSLNSEIIPRNVINDKWDALDLTIRHNKVQQNMLKKDPHLNNLIPSGKAYIDGPLFQFHRMFSAMWGLSFALEKGLTPVTDNEYMLNVATKTYKQFLSHPLGKGSSITDIDFFLSNLSSMTALNALKGFVPALGAMNWEDILELRERSRDERNSFLDSVNELVKRSRFISVDTAPEDIGPMVTEMVEREILPLTKNLSSQIEEERKKLTSTLARQFFIVSPALSLLVQSPTFNAYEVATAFLAYGGKNLVDIRDFQSKKKELKQQPDSRVASFLLSASNACVRTDRGYKETSRTFYGIDPKLVDWNNHN